MGTTWPKEALGRYGVPLLQIPMLYGEELIINILLCCLQLWQKAPMIVEAWG